MNELPPDSITHAIERVKIASSISRHPANSPTPSATGARRGYFAQFIAE
jgi:hypothetical protein